MCVGPYCDELWGGRRTGRPVVYAGGAGSKPSWNYHQQQRTPVCLLLMFFNCELIEQIFNLVAV